LLLGFVDGEFLGETDFVRIGVTDGVELVDGNESVQIGDGTGITIGISLITGTEGGRNRNHNWHIINNWNGRNR
jgi:hypothetical protein